MDALKDCKCGKKRIESLCKARDIGLETLVECLEEDPDQCPYSIFANGHYCKYPLRIHIAKKLSDNP